jgi:hypothetical protein
VKTRGYEPETSRFRDGYGIAAGLKNFGKGDGFLAKAVELPKPPSGAVIDRNDLLKVHQERMVYVTQIVVG